jgi:transmembrane sensor
VELDQGVLRGVDPAVLVRYASGESPADESAALERWVADNPARAQALNDFVRAWALAAESDAVPDTKALWNRLNAAIDATDGTHAPQRPAPALAPMPVSWHAARPSLAWMGIAATLVLAMGGAVGLRLDLAGAWHRTADRAYTTAAGQRETVTLADGTGFTLAPASTLRVPGAYAAGNRTVMLEGEAFFTVVHDSRHPFAVRVGRTVMRDVGTAFDVREYARDGAVRVAVAEGEVAVTGAARYSRPTRSVPVMLHAGDAATIGDTSVMVRHGADIASMIGWTKGTLAFDGVALSAVLADLSRWYGVSLTAPDTVLAARPVSLHLANPTLTEVLHGLADAVDARIERHADAVMLIPRSSRTTR